MDLDQIAETTEPRGPVIRDVPAVTRAVALLRVLAQTETPMGVVALSREVGAIPSTCLHILRVMVDDGLAAFDADTKRYSLGAGVLALASSFSHRNPFAQLARPALEDLSRENQLAFAAIERSDSDHVVVVAVGDVNAGVAVRLTPGTRLPVGLSASGRCFGAFGDYTAADLKRRFAKLRWDDAPSYEDWMAQIEETHRLGYAIDAGNYIRGITVIAVPVFYEQGDIAGCLTCVGLKDRLVGRQLEQTIRSMKTAATNLSWKLGGKAAPPTAA